MVSRGSRGLIAPAGGGENAFREPSGESDCSKDRERSCRPESKYSAPCVCPLGVGLSSVVGTSLKFSGGVWKRYEARFLVVDSSGVSSVSLLGVLA